MLQLGTASQLQRDRDCVATGTTGDTGWPGPCQLCNAHGDLWLGEENPTASKTPLKKYLPGLILPHPIQMQVDIPAGEAQGSSKYLCDPTMSSGL